MSTDPASGNRDFVNHAAALLGIALLAAIEVLRRHRASEADPLVLELLRGLP